MLLIAEGGNSDCEAPLDKLELLALRPAALVNACKYLAGLRIVHMYMSVAMLQKGILSR